MSSFAARRVSKNKVCTCQVQLLALPNKEKTYTDVLFRGFVQTPIIAI
jgi:hypothetical protein